MQESTIERQTNHGLTAASAEKRLKPYGFNEQASMDKRGFMRIRGELVRQRMFALLLGGCLVCLLLGDCIETLLLFALLSLTITLIREAHSEHVLDMFRNFANLRKIGIRVGKRIRIAADARFISSEDVLLDESLRPFRYAR